MDPCDPASPDWYAGNPGCIDEADTGFSPDTGVPPGLDPCDPANPAYNPADPACSTGTVDTGADCDASCYESMFDTSDTAGPPCDPSCYAEQDTAFGTDDTGGSLDTGVSEPSFEPMDPCDPAHPAYDEEACGAQVDDTAAGGPSDPCDPSHPAYDPADPACMDLDTGGPPCDTGDPSCNETDDGGDGPMDPCDPASPE